MKLLENNILDDVAAFAMSSSRLQDSPLEIRYNSELSNSVLTETLENSLEVYSCKVGSYVQKQSYQKMRRDGSPQELEVLAPPLFSDLGVSPNSQGLLANCHYARSTSNTDSTDNGSDSEQQAQMALQRVITRKTLWFLQTTLNASFQNELDFCDLDGRFFRREPSVETIINNFEAKAFNTLISTPNQAKMRQRFRAETERIMDLPDCMAFSFHPDASCDPFNGQPAEHCFIYNTKLRRILYICYRQLPLESPQLPGEIDGSNPADDRNSFALQWDLDE